MQIKRLKGRGIVVTRPRSRAHRLAALVEAEGGSALVFPTIEIESPGDPRPALALIDRLEEFELAVFVSPNAVEQAMRLVRLRRGGRPWPRRLRTAAIGRGSRRELERQGFEGVIAPQAGADSEALLALPELKQLSGKRVVIFRGEGGRELLGGTLAARGASVAVAQCYRRSRTRADRAPLLEALAHESLHALTASSSEGLVNLYEILDGPGRRRLRAIAHFVPHPRIAQTAAGLGAREVIVAGPGDAEMLAALVAYFGGTGRKGRR